MQLVVCGLSGPALPASQHQYATDRLRFIRSSVALLTTQRRCVRLYTSRPDNAATRSDRRYSNSVLIYYLLRPQPYVSLLTTWSRMVRTRYPCLPTLAGFAFFNILKILEPKFNVNLGQLIKAVRESLVQSCTCIFSFGTCTFARQREHNTQ